MFSVKNYINVCTKQPDTLKKIQVVLIYLYTFSLPFYLDISTKILVILVVVSLFVRPINRFKRASFLVFPFLYLLTIIAILRVEPFDWSYLEYRAIFVAIPLFFLTVKMSQKDIISVFKWFVIGCLTSILVCNGVAIYQSLAIKNGLLTFNSGTLNDLNFFHSVGGDNNFFFSETFSLFHQTSFFALYINVCIVIILTMKIWKPKYANYLSLVLFSISIFQLSNKSGIITLAIIFIYLSITKIELIWLKYVIAILLLIVSSMIMYLNPRGQVMIDNLIESGFSIDPDEDQGYMLRLMSWDASFDLIGNHPYLGIGLSPQNELNKVYRKKKYNKALLENFNSHNQYLQIYLEYGAIGLILLLFVLYHIGLKRTNNLSVNHFKEHLLIIIGIGFFLDSLLTRYSGISFVVFFYYLLDYTAINETQKQIINT